jgi:hypothetical protein
METVVGVFSNPSSANLASEKLMAAGIPKERISTLHPGSPGEKLASVPTTDAEQPGMGKAMAGLVGGAAGAAAGATLGTAAISVLIPGVGPVVATAMFGAVLLGAVGTSVGMRVGQAAEEFMDTGLPKDELFVYLDALKKGHSVVMVLVPDEEHASQVRVSLLDSGAETIDQAREKWEVGLRDAGKERYP